MVTEVKIITCPLCGSPTHHVSGFIRCKNPKCEHVLDSAVLNTDWARYDHGHMLPHKGADKQLPRGRTEPRRRYPLKFED